MKARSFLGHFALVTAALASTLAPLAAQEQKPLHYSQKELDQRMQEAKSPAQYLEVVTYLRNREDALRGEAQSQREIYQKWAQTGGSSKFPSRADVAHNLYVQYTAKADHVAQLANDYESRLHPPAAGEVATKTPPTPSQLTPNEQIMLDKLNQLEKQVKELSKR
jgi:hypothetical protein